MDWKSDFRSKYVGDALDCIPPERWKEMESEVFSFIENLLEQERKRVEDESIALSPPEYIREPMMVSAFNDGVRAVLSIINKK